MRSHSAPLALTSILLLASSVVHAVNNLQDLDTASTSSIVSLPASIFTTSPPSLDSLANNSLFIYWRPKAHFIAPNVSNCFSVTYRKASCLSCIKSWQNDPMNMWVDNSGKNGSLKWHVGYQVCDFYERCYLVGFSLIHSSVSPWPRAVGQYLARSFILGL